MLFEDRADAGRKLAGHLKRFAGHTDVNLFALPRGGVVVGAEVARVLGLPLDVIITRKIGAPENPEYAIGALAETGEMIWNEEERSSHAASEVERVVDLEKQEMLRRIQTYRQGRPLPDLQGKTALIIDDGIATGLTMQAALAAARHQRASRVIIAVPHGAKDTLHDLRGKVDEIIALEEPLFYGSVGQYYVHFPQVADDEVLRLLA
mgnify:CR=1 FL=1